MLLGLCHSQSACALAGAYLDWVSTYQLPYRSRISSISKIQNPPPGTSTKFQRSFFGAQRQPAALNAALCGLASPLNQIHNPWAWDVVAVMQKGERRLSNMGEGQGSLISK